MEEQNVQKKGAKRSLVVDPGFEFLEMIFQVGRWGYEHECVVVLHYLVDV